MSSFSTNITGKKRKFIDIIDFFSLYERLINKRWAYLTTNEEVARFPVFSQFRSRLSTCQPREDYCVVTDLIDKWLI